MTDRSLVAEGSHLRDSWSRCGVAESSLSTAAEGDFTSLVTTQPTSDKSCSSLKPTRETLTAELERLERADPAVAAAAASLDRCVDDLTYLAELQRFRPLPWERAAAR